MPAPRFHPLARLLLCGVGILFAQLVASFAGIIIYLLVSHPSFGSPAQINQTITHLIDQVKNNVLLLTIIGNCASLVWIAIARKQFDVRSVASLGLRRSRLLPNFARGALTGLFSMGLLWSILWLLGALSINGWSPEAMQAGVFRSIAWLLLYFLIYCNVGLFEEVLFRGYILQNLNAWMGWTAAFIIQAVLFAAIHLGNSLGIDDPAAKKEAMLATLQALPSIALIGVLFALFWRKTGSLWFPIGFHMAWDWSQGCLFSMPVSGINNFRLLDVQNNAISPLTGGSFGTEGSWLLPPIILVLIYVISKAPDHPQALLDLQLLKGELSQPPTVPSYAVAAPANLAPTLSMEEEEEQRENRFKSRFGGAEGFDSHMLRELREMQEQREKTAQEALQAQREYELHLRRQEEERLRQQSILTSTSSNEAAMEIALASTATAPRAEPAHLEVTPVAATATSESPLPVPAQAPTESAPAPAVAPEVVEKRSEPQGVAPTPVKPTPVEVAPVAPEKSVAPQAPTEPVTPATTVAPTTEKPAPPVAPVAPKKNAPRW